MSEETAPTTGPATAGEVGRVDAACDRFEAAFKAGRDPRIEVPLPADGRVPSRRPVRVMKPRIRRQKRPSGPPVQDGSLAVSRRVDVEFGENLGRFFSMALKHLGQKNAKIPE